MPRLTVGLTGGMGAGKTVVASRLAALGARVVAADDVARELVNERGPVFDELVCAFGAGIVAADGTLDRRALARTAFASEEATGRLNAIVHPPLVARLLSELEEGDDILVIDAALLAEWGILDAFDVTVVVVAPLEQRIERLTSAGYDPVDARARIAAQLDPAVVAKRVDIVIENDSSLSDLGRRADEVWRELLERVRETT